MLDCLKLFLSVDILLIILKYTNKKASEFITIYNKSNAVKMKPLDEIDIVEIFAFLKILVLTEQF